jgi:REP-associated tyrosine transposase
MAPQDYQLFYQRHLPHYQPPGATLFITFRLAGSLPGEVMLRLEAEARQSENEIDGIVDLEARKEAFYSAQKRLFARLDGELDIGIHGPRWLSEPAIAHIVCEALHYRDGRVYTLEAYCVMPNHVHLVCTPLGREGIVESVSNIMHSLKGFTARQANLLLGREGAFWQHESYDHVIRDAEEHQRIVNYVMANPARAGLPAYWVYCMSGE